VIAAIVATVALATGGIPAPPHGSVVFASERPVPTRHGDVKTQADVYLAVPGTKKLRRLAWGPADEDQPALSPDRLRLAFVRTVWTRPQVAFHGVSTVFVKRLATRRLVRLGRGRSPSWSPDGSRLALVTARGLETVRRDGSGRRLVVAGTMTSAVWSPDGSLILYAAKQPDGFVTLWVVRPDGIGRSALGLKGTTPAWSPDGKRIAYSDFFGVWVADADGANPRQLTRIGDDPSRDINADLGPTWSPDGTRIAYAEGLALWDAETTGVIGPGAEPEPYSLLVVPAGGGAPEPFVGSGPIEAADYDPQWIG